MTEGVAYTHNNLDRNLQWQIRSTYLSSSRSEIYKKSFCLQGDIAFYYRFLLTTWTLGALLSKYGDSTDVFYGDFLYISSEEYLKIE